ncbi:DNA cytosine methyltransferase [Amedibacillus dolichus]|uniref:DNA cytosine methyltransferase n=1 Tax=Amedibacillus dolichus TaxID=31971 RepID=UPI0039A2CFB3
MPYSVVDLFAGAGGLSLGFMQTGKYDIKVAFEREPYMQATYHRNHPNVELQGDVCSADYDDIQRRYGTIDVIIGGPPCQGFSNANRQKNHAISQNNMLVKQYIRAIRELHPKAFVMENVSMLRSDVHRFYMEEADLDIVDEYQIPNKNTPLHLLDTEFVFDDALELVQNLDLIQQNLWPENHYRELNIIYKGEKNVDKMKKSLENHQHKLTEIAQTYIEDDTNSHIAQKSKEAFKAIMDYFDGTLEADKIHALIEPAIIIQRMLSKAKEIFDNHIHVDSYECTEKDGILANIRSFAVFDYLKGILTSGEDGYAINSGVLCAADFGAPQKRNRFVVIGIKKSISNVVFLPPRKIKDGHYKTVHDAIFDLEDVTPVYNLAEDKEGIPLEPKDQLSSVAQQLRDSNILKNHIITKTTDVAMKRFKALHQGENFHSLNDSLKTNTYTDVKRTQNTIYLRLDYNEPSGTVLNVRKSMWIHPTLDRAISVREAARLQTFPDSFVFCGSKDKQYQQVGNAVPPIMAKAIAKQLASTLGRKLRKAEQENG